MLKFYKIKAAVYYYSKAIGIGSKLLDKKNRLCRNGVFHVDGSKWMISALLSEYSINRNIKNNVFYIL